MFKKNCLLILFFIFVLACSKEPKKVDNILNETKVEDQMVVAYKEGIKALQEGDSLFASKKFNEPEETRALYSPRECPAKYFTFLCSILNSSFISLKMEWLIVKIAG